MATLVNKMNREVKVIIPNMREFRTFYSDSEGIIGVFFKREWEEITEKEEHWKPSEELLEALHTVAYIPEIEFYGGLKYKLRELDKQLKGHRI